MVKIIGECTYRECRGACCKVLGLPAAGTPVWGHDYVRVPLDETPNAEAMAWYRARGVRVQRRLAAVPCKRLLDNTERVRRSGQKRLLVLSHACRQLRENGSCRLHDTPEFPTVCSLYPTVAHDLDLVKHACGYRIVEDGDA